MAWKNHWMRSLPQPWSAATEATMFTRRIYDHLQPHAAALKVAHPLTLRAIAAAKKKNDQNNSQERSGSLGKFLIHTTTVGLNG
jgi:hypothetical protein